ncbi:hypothetical protein O0L34_g14159 [Tuta absoluta]|nr:hypothetical protein O0L34_g14159 [Tuta absoluta]
MAKINAKTIEEIIKRCMAPYTEEIQRLTSIIRGLEQKISGLHHNGESIRTTGQDQQPLTSKPIGSGAPMTSTSHQPLAAHEQLSDTGKVPSDREKRAAARSLRSTNNISSQHQMITPAPKTPPNTQQVLTNTGNAPQKLNEQPKKHTVIPVRFDVSDARDCDQNKEATESAVEWTVHTTKRARKPRKSVIVGSGSINDEIQTVEKLKYIQAWSFKPDTTTGNITKFLHTVAPSSEYFVEKRDIQTKKHACFIIGMPESLYATINSPAVWPQGVKISDWFFLTRPRAARGSQSSAGGSGRSDQQGSL